MEIAEILRREKELANKTSKFETDLAASATSGGAFGNTAACAADTSVFDACRIGAYDDEEAEDVASATADAAAVVVVVVESAVVAFVVVVDDDTPSPFRDENYAWLE